MTLINALKANKPIRLPGRVFNSNSYNGIFGFDNNISYTSDSWKDPEWLLSVVNFTKEDLLSDKWEVKED